MTGIIPPFLLEAIAANGTPTQQIAARRTLEIDSQIRAEREAAATARSEPVAPAHRPRPHKNRKIYSAGNAQGLVRSEGQGPSGDVGVDEAYDGFGATFDLYWDIYGRNSLDDDGQDLIALVHYPIKPNNAMWNGTQVVFGDGDGESFKRFTLCVDVIGHELTHGVIQAVGKLPYYGQAGALNESLSDVFGSLVKQRTLGQTAKEADWLIGAGMFVPEIDAVGVRSMRAAGTALHDQPGINGVALRSMSAPGTAFHDPVLIHPLMPDGKDPQPDHMSGYVALPEDDDHDRGGVHINSGIPNRAFYLAAVAIGGYAGGYAWDTAGKIWYQALVTLQKYAPDFQQFATLTAQVAEELYRTKPEIRHMVVSAWHEVGLGGDVLHLIVPDVRELRPALAASELQSLGLVPKFNGPNTAHSWVFSQSPLPGHWVALGSTVTMVLHTGPIP